ncbi:peptidoglycan-binding protein [Nonomuraea angiospora]|uniref:peptidoglycan-binding protein n=1 Tax=Nonomuraea angiospora TaxID=46172 RepID=UPI00341D76A4
MRRSRVLALVVVGVLVIAGVGWAVGSRLRSPADEASSRRPPKPSLITAPVERRKLTSTVTVSGTLTYGSPLPVTLAGMVGGSGGIGGANGAPQRVTTAPKPGPLREGQTLMQVNGRPVFALQGKKPMYRPLVPGTEGKDVEQLQRALRVKKTGIFDAATVAAVRRWYAKRGYKAQEPDLEARKSLQQLRQAVQTAKETLTADRKALNEGLDVRPLRIRHDNARRDLKAAEKALEEAPEITPEQETQLAVLRRAVRTAEEQVLAAEQALAEATRPAPTPTTTATPAPMPSAVDTSLLEMKVANARQDLYEAQQAVAAYEEQVRVERDKRLEELRKAVRVAKEAEATAAQALSRARKVSPLRQKVTHSIANLADAQALLAEFRKTYGVSVPAGEIVFLPKLPARIDKAEVKPGDTIEGKVATVTSSAFAVTGSVEAKEAKLLRAGQEASMETMDGTQLPATLSAVGEAAKTEEKPGEEDNESETGSVPVLLTPGSAKALKSLVGSPMTVRISVGSTEGEVLAVPVTAVVTSADGRPRVRVALDGDRTREVEVRTGLTADGDVEVKPVRAGELKEGDRVVVSDA